MPAATGPSFALQASTVDMDPVTVMATVGEVGKVVTQTASSLHQLTHGNNDIHPVLSPLFEEIRALKRSISAVDWLVISVFCDSPVVASHEPSEDRSLDRLWNSVTISIEDCKITCEKLIIVFQKLQHLVGSNLLTSALLATAFNEYAGPILQLRLQIQSHREVVEDILQTLNSFIKKGRPLQEKPEEMDSDRDVLIRIVSRSDLTSSLLFKQSGFYNESRPITGGKTDISKPVQTHVSGQDLNFSSIFKTEKCNNSPSSEIRKSTQDSAAEVEWQDPDLLPRPLQIPISSRREAKPLHIQTARETECDISTNPRPRMRLSPRRFAEISSWDMLNATNNYPNPLREKSRRRSGPLQVLQPMDLNTSNVLKGKKPVVSWIEIVRSKSPLSRITLLGQSRTKRHNTSSNGYQLKST
ncbi:hypothetical protein BGZ60DRAFT_26896 [Tricladium varicosporioides]|nr:hypothetical protein BGZ60DRAFT_26896 [Hymenoscyphus varicosporioides]